MLIWWHRMRDHSVLILLKGDWIWTNNLQFCLHEWKLLLQTEDWGPDSEKKTYACLPLNSSQSPLICPFILRRICMCFQSKLLCLFTFATQRSECLLQGFMAGCWISWLCAFVCLGICSLIRMQPKLTDTTTLNVCLAMPICKAVQLLFHISVTSDKHTNIFNSLQIIHFFLSNSKLFSAQETPPESIIIEMTSV